MRKDSNSPQVLSTLVGFLLVFNLFVAPLNALASAANVPATLNASASADPVYEISPSSGVQGKEYDVLVTSNPCLQDSAKNPLKDRQLRAPGGSGITVTDSKATDCRLTAHLAVGGAAAIGVVKLQVVDKDGNLKDVVDFTVTAIVQGPIPPGLNGQGQVDVMWSILPDKITDDNFGGKVKRQFYCVEVVIGNDSGFDLQLASIGFTLPGLENDGQKIPTTGYRTVRGSLEAFQLVAPRSFVVNGLKMLGPILTGFLPFFHAANHATNFSEAINLISNPIEKGVENIWPDLTPRELDRLADMTFRDDISTKTIIPNNVQARILTFVPKELVFPHKQKIKKSTGIDQYLSPDNPQDVMRALGKIVLVGQQIVHVNRVRVVATGLEAPVVDQSISGRITDGCEEGVSGITVTLSGGSDFTAREVTTSPDGTFIIPNVPVGRTYTVTPKLENLTFSPRSPGSETFTLNDTKTNLNFRADYAVLVISGKVVDNSSHPVRDLDVSLSSSDFNHKVQTNEAGVFRFEIPGSRVKLPAGSYVITPNGANHTFDQDTRTWKCNERQVDFVATPKPTPTASPSPSPTATR